MSVIKCLKSVNKNVAKTASSFLFARHKSDLHKNILYSDLPDVEIPRLSIDEYVFLKTDNFHDKVAAECAITGRKYTYEQMRSKSTNFSRALRKKLKLQKGDVVAILLPNCPEFVLVAVGALKAGLVVTTLNPIYTPDEISRQLEDSSTKAIITLIDFYPLAKSSLNVIQKNVPILAIKTQESQKLPPGALSFEEFTDKIDFPDLPPADPQDVALLPYSSGTTGHPKGVELTHRNIIANLQQFNQKEIKILQKTTSSHQDVLPGILPKFHIYGLVANTLNILHVGAKTVDLPKFNPELYLNILRKHKPDVLFLAPPVVLFLASHPMVKSKDLQSVRTIVSGAAPLGALDEQRFLEKAQKDILVLQGYGLTETSPMVTMTRADIRKLPGSGGTIGRLVSLTSAKIIDPDDPSETALGPNQKGELLIKGPQVMKGYFKKPQQTQEAFTKDGWLRTGDIMMYNEDELLFVSDRLKELIKVKGFQVPPAELEEIIRDFPDVEDVAVIGVPHANYGEIPRAYVVPKKGMKVDSKRLDAFVSEKVAEYKRLIGGIEIVESIPKNASGKIMRRELKTRFENTGK